MTLYPRDASEPDIRIRIPAIVIRIPGLRAAIRPIIPIAACDEPPSKMIINLYRKKLRPCHVLRVLVFFV